MADITLRSSNPVSATSVSNTFIDEYMSDANGEFVKIYLYLLRLMNIPKASYLLHLLHRGQVRPYGKGYQARPLLLGAHAPAALRIRRQS